MEILKLSILCCLIVKCVTANLAELRVVRPTITNDVLGVMRSAEGLSEFKGVFELLNEKNGYKTDMKMSAGKNLTLALLNQTRDCLKPLSYSFMLWTSVYLMQILRGYMEIAIRLLNDESLSAKTGVSDRHKREVLRFENEPEYCMLTAFYDWGGFKKDAFDANLLFESSYFLQTIRADAKSSLSDLEFQLRSYGHRYDAILYIQETKSLRNRFTAVPTSSFATYSDLLAGMKKEFSDLSRVFCSTWSPFVRSDLLRADAQLNYFQNQSPFVRYTFHYETCEINFQQKKEVPDQISEFADHKQIQEENQQNQITTWNCEKILDSPEYRYQIYNKDVDSGKNTDHTHNGDVIFRRKPSKPAAAADIPFKDKQRFSVAALRDGLKSNNHYANAVKYYDIAADVMLLVSIKEGDKMLRGIKLAVSKKCNAKPVKLLADEVRRMRCALLRFKSIFAQLVALILGKRRVDVAENRHKRTFDGLVGSVMEALNVKNDPMTDGQVERICAEIPIILADIRADHGFIGYPLKFVSFYFHEAILNIRELYHFGENHF